MKMDSANVQYFKINMSNKSSMITWYDSREKKTKDGDGIFVCCVRKKSDGTKIVAKASGVYKASDNTLHFLKVSGYLYYRWAYLDDINP